MPLQEWAKRKLSHGGRIIIRGYCLGHWGAFGLVAVYQPRLFGSWWPLDYFLTALLIARLGSFQWIATCWGMNKAGK